MIFNKKGGLDNTPFLTILAIGLMMGALALAFSYILSTGAATYGLTLNDTSYNNIVSASNQVSGITQNSSNTYFGNSTRTNQANSVDRLIGTGYNTILVLGSIPSVYEQIIYSIAGEMSIDATLANYLIAGIMAIVVTTAIFLAVGRGR